MTTEEKVILSIFGIALTVFSIILYIEFTQYEREYFTEYVTGKVMASAELEKFDIGMGIVGYAAGENLGSGMGIPIGGMVGLASASGCDIPVLINNQAVVVEESSTQVCEGIKVGLELKLFRNYVIRTHIETGEKNRIYRDFKLE